MTLRGNRGATRCPGLMRSVADGSTYDAPVVETGSFFHSGRTANAMTSPLSRRLAPMVAHSVRPTKRPRQQERRLGLHRAPGATAVSWQGACTGELPQEDAPTAAGEVAGAGGDEVVLAALGSDGGI